jgi:DNA-binding beta-propeller fold protein YncE
MNKTGFALGCLLLASAVGGFAQTGKTSYAITDRIRLEGDGGWDYLAVDGKTSRLYVSHGTQVNVVDLATNKPAGIIHDTPGVHGIAIADDLDRGFISDGRDSSVTVFNLKNLKTIEKVRVTGANPDAILYDPYTKRVFVYNGRSANATVLDGRTGKVVGTIPLPGKPEFSVTDGEGSVYVNIEDKSLICKIDPVKMTVTASWPIAPGEEPSGLAFDVANHRLFSVCGNKLMMVVDSDNGKIVAKLDIGEGVDGAAFDPVLRRAYSSNGEGSLTVVQEDGKDSFRVLETVATQRGARTLTIDPMSHKIYSPTAEYETTVQTSGNQRQRPRIKSGSFAVLEVSVN